MSTSDVWLESGRSTADESASVDLRAIIERLVDKSTSEIRSLTAAERAELKALYRPVDDALLWLDGDGRLKTSAREALGLLRQADDDALDPADYDQHLLVTLAPLIETNSATLSELARFEVALSAAMLRYMRHLHMGRIDPQKIGFRLEVPHDEHDFPALLRSAVAGSRVKAAAADLRPPLAQYRMLRAMLVHYRSLADSTLVAVPQITSAVHVGDLFGEIGALQRELIALGDLPPNMPPPQEPGRYEGAVVDGVKRFQVRHGLETDGVLGKKTVAALRVPLASRVRQIELALERLRWLPHVGDIRLLALNIPMFRLWAWDTIPPSGMPLFGMDAIVGRALDTQTPVFVEDMREVVFRPYWNVPRSILHNELLPKLARDPDYLSREDMEIVRGDGDNAQHMAFTPEVLAGLRQGLFRVRQRPGPKNALGLIKFVFPNEEGVYMHDTPAQALFARTRRDFSHGYVRVADPVSLAEWVLQDRPEWTRERILMATMGSQTIHVTLPRPIRVILFYTTAAVMPEDQTIRFAEDIYRHDATLDRALAAAAGGSAGR